MKKYFQTLCVMALFAIGFCSSDLSDSQSTETSENFFTQLKKSMEEDAKYETRFQGTYIITDEDGVKWTFTFTCGDPLNQVTAIKEGMSEDDMYYGKWSKRSNYISMDFGDFYAHDPELRFPDGTMNWYGADNLLISEDGWLYKNYDYWKSKNPNHRIKVYKQ